MHHPERMHRIGLPCLHQRAVLSTYYVEGQMPPPASALAHRLAVIHMSNIVPCALASGVHVFSVEGRQENTTADAPHTRPTV